VGSVYQRAGGWVRSLTGVVVATCTPFDDFGQIDRDRLGPYVDFLLARGVAGLMVGGTTSEFIAMTVEERAELITLATQATAGRAPVIAHVGHVHLREALHLAEAAARAGAPALTAIVPYYQAHTEAAIIDHLRAVARAVPELPFLVYNYPDAAANRLSAEGFEEVLQEPNVAGIKLSVASMAEIAPFLRRLPDVCVMCGNDGIWAEFTANGGRAVVSGNAAAVPELAVALMGAYLSGDAAASGRLKPLMDEVLAIGHRGAVGPLRELLRSRGFDIGEPRIQVVSPREREGAALPSPTLRASCAWDVGTVGSAPVSGGRA
jgi:dihydrodipicolinate synthase/N-acetylneuraminate lyase